MTKKDRYKGIVAWFEENVPVAETELHYDTPFHLLIAVILSAQCTDKRVNMVTPALFEAYPDPQTLAKASFDEVFPFVRSISYPNNTMSAVFPGGLGCLTARRLRLSERNLRPTLTRTKGPSPIIGSYCRDDMSALQESQTARSAD